MWRCLPASITTEFRHRSRSLRIITLKVGETGNKQTEKKPLRWSKVFLFGDGSMLKLKRRTGAGICTGLTHAEWILKEPITTVHLWKLQTLRGSAQPCHSHGDFPLHFFFYCDQQWVNRQWKNLDAKHIQDMDSNRKPKSVRLIFAGSMPVTPGLS